MSKLPSASSVGRWMICTASQILPPVDSADESEYASKGRQVHEFLRTVLAAPDREAAFIPALAAVTDEKARVICEAIDLDALPRGGVHEYALAYNPTTDTARLLGENIDRQYEAHGADREEEITLTPDIAGVLEDSEGKYAFAPDFKTGAKAGAARKSWQMRVLGLGTARYFGVERAKAPHLHIDDVGDVRQGAPLVLDAFDLAGIAGALNRKKEEHKLLVVEQRAGRRLPVVQGSHCLTPFPCKAILNCPAWTSLLRASIDPAEVGDATGLALNSETINLKLLGANIKLALAMRDAIDLFLDQATGLARTLSRGVPIIGPSGEEESYFVEMPGRIADKIVNADKARTLLTSLYGEEVASAAVTTEAHTTKAAIKAALAPWCRARGRKLKDEEEHCYKQLRECGAIDRKEGEAKVKLVSSEEAHRVFETLPAAGGGAA